MHAMQGCGGVEVQLHLLLIWALIDVRVCLHALAALPSGINSSVAVPVE